MDWSKYTDEGWYGDAAIRHFQRGHWYVPGDFNPAAALPVWPLLEAGVFRFTGVSLTAARALTVCIFGGTLSAAYLLLRRWQPAVPFTGAAEQLPLPFVDGVLEPPRLPLPAGLPDQGQARQRTLAPAIGVLLLAVSPFCFAFTRIAILEPLLIFLTLLALIAASSTFKMQVDATGSPQAMPRLYPVLALGFLLPAMVLTKTTAVFLFPSVAFLLLASSGYRFRVFLRAALPAGLIAGACWSAYFFAFVRPHYLMDYRYLFSANAYTGITAATALKVLYDTVMDGVWIGKLLFPLAMAAMLWAFLRPNRLLRHPLTAALILWALGYAAFLAYHNNLQPRYYLVPAVPLTLLVAVVCEPALRRFRATLYPTHTAPAHPVLAVIVSVLLAAVVLHDARQTLNIIRHPDYTLVDAADGIARVVRGNPARSPLILSISGSNLSLITGLPSVCDDFGTLELADRVKKYRPGWYAAWNQIEDDKMDALTPLYHPVRVASFPALDDPARNLLILYRLDPRISTSRLRSRHQLIPRPLQTKIGQQPSETQLLH